GAPATSARSTPPPPCTAPDRVVRTRRTTSPMMTATGRRGDERRGDDRGGQAPRGEAAALLLPVRGRVLPRAVDPHLTGPLGAAAGPAGVLDPLGDRPRLRADPAHPRPGARGPGAPAPAAPAPPRARDGGDAEQEGPCSLPRTGRRGSGTVRGLRAHRRRDGSPGCGA